MSTRTLVSGGARVAVGAKRVQQAKCPENEDIIEALLSMADKLSSNGGNTDYKAQAFRRAAASVQKCPVAITNKKEALGLQNVGPTTATHIMKVVEKRKDRTDEGVHRSPENVSSNSMSLQLSQSSPVHKKRAAPDSAVNARQDDEAGRENKRARAPNLRKVFDSGMLPSGSAIEFVHEGTRVPATVDVEGRILYNGKTYTNPTGFANAAKSDSVDRYITDGWSCVFFNGTSLKMLQQQISDPSATVPPSSSHSSASVQLGCSSAANQSVRSSLPRSGTADIRGLLSGGTEQSKRLTGTAASKLKKDWPKKRSAAYALLLALFRMKEGVGVDSQERVPKKELAAFAQQWSDTTMLSEQQERGAAGGRGGGGAMFYDGWSCMNQQLIKKGLVETSKQSRFNVYALTPEGEGVGRRLHLEVEASTDGGGSGDAPAGVGGGSDPAGEKHAGRPEAGASAGSWGAGYRLGGDSGCAGGASGRGEGGRGGSSLQGGAGAGAGAAGARLESARFGRSLTTVGGAHRSSAHSSQSSEPTSSLSRSRASCREGEAGSEACGSGVQARADSAASTMVVDLVDDDDDEHDDDLDDHDQEHDDDDHDHDLSLPASSQDSTGAVRGLSAGADVDTRPMCKYGANCYQKNQYHLNRFQHPLRAASRGAGAVGSGAHQAARAMPRAEHSEVDARGAAEMVGARRDAEEVVGAGRDVHAMDGVGGRARSERLGAWDHAEEVGGGAARESQRDVCGAAMPGMSGGEWRVRLLVDSMEPEHVTTWLARHRVKFCKTKLETGDFMWAAVPAATPPDADIKHVDARVLDFMMERKRVDDLVQSITGKRYDSQKHRMGLSGIKGMMYLLEGESSHAVGQPMPLHILQSDKYASSTWEDRIRSATVETQVFGGMMPFRTRSTKETGALLQQLTEEIEALVAERGLVEGAALMEDGAPASLAAFQARMQHAKSDLPLAELFQVQMTRAVAGLGGKAAGALGAEFGTLARFLEAMAGCADAAACEKMLREVCKRQKCRALSGKCSQTLWRLWSGEGA